MSDNDNKNPNESHPIDRYNPGNQAGKGPTFKDEPKRENKGDEDHREKQSRQ